MLFLFICLSVCLLLSNILLSNYYGHTSRVGDIWISLTIQRLEAFRTSKAQCVCFPVQCWQIIIIKVIGVEWLLVKMAQLSLACPWFIFWRSAKQTLSLSCEAILAINTADRMAQLGFQSQCSLHTSSPPLSWTRSRLFSSCTAFSHNGLYS